MNKKMLFGGLVLAVAFSVIAFHKNALGYFGESLVKKGTEAATGAAGAVGGAVGGAVDWSKGTVDSAGRTLIGEAGKAGDWVGKVTEDGLKIVDSAGNWVLTEAGKIAKAVGCMAQAGVSVTGDIVKSLAGKSISFDEVSVEGTLGGATFAVKAKGSIAGKSFDLSSSIGKDGFTQDGFKQLFYDPLAKIF